MGGIFRMYLKNICKPFQTVIARSPGGTTKQSVDLCRSVEIELNLNGLLRFARNDIFKKDFGINETLV
jgi:hypothetical protein